MTDESDKPPQMPQDSAGIGNNANEGESPLQLPPPSASSPPPLIGGSAAASPTSAPDARTAGSKRDQSSGSGKAGPAQLDPKTPLARVKVPKIPLTRVKVFSSSPPPDVANEPLESDGPIDYELGEPTATPLPGVSDGPIDYELGEPTAPPLPGVSEGVARLEQELLLVLHGRLGIKEVVHDIASLRKARWRWACRLDGDAGYLQHTHPDAIRQFVATIDRWKQSEATERGLLVAELDYQPLSTLPSFQQLLLTTHRPALLQALNDCHCVFIAAVSVPDLEADPRKTLPSTLSMEVPWPDVLIRQLRQDSVGALLEDQQADRLLSIIRQHVAGAADQALDDQFCHALRDIASLKMGVEQLTREVERRLNSVLSKQGTSDTAHMQPDTPDRYDVRNAIHEIMTVVALFLGPINRAVFDRLVGALLPDDTVPAEMLPTERQTHAHTPPSGTMTPGWPGAVWFGTVSPAVAPAVSITWRTTWDEDADLYRDERHIRIVNGEARLDDAWERVRHLRADALLERRQARVERIAFRIIERNLILNPERSLSDSATKLLAALAVHLGLAIRKDSLIDLLNRLLQRDLRPKTGIRRLVERVSALLDHISDAIGSDFAAIVHESLRELANRNIRDPWCCCAVIALCLSVRGNVPRWRSGQTYSDTVRHIFSQAPDAVREEVEDQLRRDLQYAVRDPLSRLSFLLTLQPWLPRGDELGSLPSTQALALEMWDSGLNADILWSTPRNYAERGTAETLASIAFGFDAEIRIGLVRGLASFQLRHLAILRNVTDDISQLQDRFADAFWTTLHGFEPADAKLILEKADSFASVFATLVLMDKPVLPDVIVRISQLESTGDEHSDDRHSIDASSTADDDDLEAFEGSLTEMAILVRGVPFGSLAYIYRDSLAEVHRNDDNGRRARERIAKLDLFHAALLAEWFFLRFGIREDSLTDAEYALVDTLASTITEIDLDGLGRRLPVGLVRLSRIVDGYGPILTKLRVSRSTARNFYLKSRKLRGLANVLSGRAKMQADERDKGRLSRTSFPP
jgi:hypothetical protein